MANQVGIKTLEDSSQDAGSLSIWGMTVSPVPVSVQSLSCKMWQNIENIKSKTQFLLSSSQSVSWGRYTRNPLGAIIKWEESSVKWLSPISHLASRYELIMNTDVENGHNEMISVCLSQWSLTESQSHVIRVWRGSTHPTRTMAQSIFNFSQNSSHTTAGNIFKLMNFKDGLLIFKKYEGGKRSSNVTTVNITDIL